MYEAHFGLSPRPFGDLPRSLPGVGLPSRDAAIRRLRFGIEHGRGPALLFGPSGSGKTRLAFDLAAEIGLPTAHLSFPSMPATDLLAFLADELHAPPGEPGMAGSVRRIGVALREATLQGRRTLLIVDEAHLIDDPASFETLRLLLNFSTEGPPDLSLLIVGGPEVLLQIPPALSDRLTARAMIGPLNREESALYVEGRLARAGASGPIFGRDALVSLHVTADGLPRRLNRLADLALLIAYAEGRLTVDERTIEVAADEAAFEPIGV